MNRKERRIRQSAGGQGARAPAGSQAAAAGPAAGRAAQLFAQALKAHQAGRLAEAEPLYRQGLALDPENAEACNYFGILCQQKGDGAAAVEYLGRAARLRPESADLVNNLGIAHLKQEDGAAAEACFERAIGLNPFLAQAHYNLGLALRKQRKPVKALACFRQAIAVFPKYANAYLSLGNLLSDMGKPDEAVAEFRNMLAFTPNARIVHYNIAMTYKSALRYEEAAEAARELLDLEPGNVAGHCIIAQFQRSIGRYEESEKIARRAVALGPDDADAHAALGTVLSIMGRFDEATEHLTRALEIQPDNSEAVQFITVPSKAHATPELAAKIESVLSRERPPTQTAMLHFGLGKIYDELGDYARAFEHYRTGNAIAVESSKFRPEEWDDYIGREIAAFDKDFFAERKSFGSESRRPIFIFGMPRSGTTLIEQIIASHAEVAPGGELAAMPGLAAGLPHRLKTKTGYPECVRELTPEDARAVAADYLAALDDVAGNAPFVTDKAPLNFTHLGLMALLFPNAAFIHCRRDPLDTCLSCFFKFFEGPLSFTYDLDHLGRFYRSYRRLMDHWRKVLPVRMLEVDYEALVENQEEVSRRLIAHCGLDWDDNCLRFHETERPVMTASVWQVRQPIYKSAMKRWKNYEPFLAPLIDALGTDARTGAEAAP